MTKKKAEKQPIAPALRALDKGKCTAFKLHRLATVKNTCSYLSLTEGMQFSTHLNRTDKVIEVTRVR